MTKNSFRNTMFDNAEYDYPSELMEQTYTISRVREEDDGQIELELKGKFGSARFTTGDEGLDLKDEL